MDEPRLTAAEAARLGYNDCLRYLRDVEERAVNARPLRVAVLRSYTVEPIEPVLKLRLLLEGFKPSLRFGGYNQYAQEILESDGWLHQFKPDLVLLLIRIEEVLPDFIDDFASCTPERWGQRIESAVSDLDALAARLQQTLPAQVIVQNATLLRTPAFGVFDGQRPDGQAQLLQEFNRRLSAKMNDRVNTYIWDFDALVRAAGADTLLDPKQWYTARNPFRQSAYPVLVNDLLRYVLSVLGRSKKCIALDLDNTLWGGVVGEDGLEGIRLGRTYPGNCYRAFQIELLKLQRRGILLAINSKNNEDDALRVIDEHPDMVLRRQHFAAIRINWQDKATNLRALVRELGIGLDSVLFVDDNPAECELITRECPECDVLTLPDKPYLLPDVLNRLPGLENIRMTNEDRQKSAMYMARAERQQLEERSTNLSDFLNSLGIEVTIEPATRFSLPRIAQLTQKTNQMNMTTRRYTEAHVQAFVADPRYDVYSVAARDRFGDDGIVGVFILRFADGDCAIDSFLLSCRVIARGIEDLMVAFIADLARERGARTLTGEFLVTARNKPAAGLYERLGFQVAGGTLLRADLHDTTFPYPAHLRLKTTERPTLS